MTNNRPLSIPVCTGLLTALCFSAAAVPEKDRQPIVVEAFGFGIPEAGKPEVELRQEAIEDALGNAEMQSYVDLDIQVRIENMRTKERTMYLSSRGSVELSQILAANYVTNSTLPLYRVQVEALVHPASISPPASSTHTDIDRKYPEATLVVQSISDPELGKNLQHALAEYLRKSGFHLVNRPTDPETIVMNISLNHQSGNPRLELQWNMEKRYSHGTDGSFLTERIMGNRLVPHPDQSPAELQKLGALLARNAARLATSVPFP